MSDSQLPWFRFYTETITDTKFEVAANLLSCRKMELIGTWATLLALASRSPLRGKLAVTKTLPYRYCDIAVICGEDTDWITEVISVFISLDMMHQDGDFLVITNFDKRQFASDSSKERVRALRERYKTVTVTPPDTDTDTDTERESQASKPTDSFDDMRRLVEQMTGYPIPNTEDDTKAITELVKLKAEKQDFQDALAFFSGNGKIARGPAKLLESVKVSIARRIQAANSQPSTKPFIPEDHASEVYG